MCSAFQSVNLKLNFWNTAHLSLGAISPLPKIPICLRTIYIITTPTSSIRPMIPREGFIVSGSTNLLSRVLNTSFPVKQVESSRSLTTGTSVLKLTVQHLTIRKSPLSEWWEVGIAAMWNERELLRDREIDCRNGFKNGTSLEYKGSLMISKYKLWTIKVLKIVFATQRQGQRFSIWSWAN